MIRSDIGGTVYEHANLRNKTTGQPFDFWVDEVGCDRKVSHNEPRFKPTANGIQLDIILHNNDDIEIVNSEQEIKKFKYAKQAKQFVYDFREPLRMHWNHEIDTGELAYIMRKVYKDGATVLDALSDLAQNY